MSEVITKSSCASVSSLELSNGEQKLGDSQTTVTSNCASAIDLEICNGLLKGVTVSRLVKWGYFVVHCFVIPHLIIILMQMQSQTLSVYL